MPIRKTDTTELHREGCRLMRDRSERLYCEFRITAMTAVFMANRPLDLSRVVVNGSGCTLDQINLTFGVRDLI